MAQVPSPPPCRRSPTRSVTPHVAASTCSYASTTTASRRRRSPSSSACTPTSPVTTSTSSPPAATSRSRSNAPRARAPGDRRSAIAPSPNVSTECPVRSDDLVLSLLGKALALLPSEQAEAMAEQVGHEYGRAMAAGLSGPRSRRRPPLAAVGDAGRRRCADGARLRRPRRPAQRPAADHQRPLPVRRCGHRAPGDLRRRSRHGEGHARRALCGDTDVSTEASLPRATPSAPPRSDALLAESAAYSITRSTISSSHFASEPLSNGGCGSYSIISCAASAAVRSTSNSTSRSAMSMPLDTPAAVMIRRSRCSTTRSAVGDRAGRLQLGVARPVRRGGQPVEQIRRRRGRASRCTPTS